MAEQERNIGYVVGLVNDNPGKLDLFELTRQTRLKHSRDDPLGFREARDAIEEAKKRGLIETKIENAFFGLDYAEEIYHPVKRNEGK